jgi:hypothetical protein
MSLLTLNAVLQALNLKSPAPVAARLRYLKAKGLAA